jgi:hypothetical protein
MFRVEHDTATGEVKEIALTATEIKTIEKLQKEAVEKDAAIKAQAEAKAQAKATAEGKLAALGLTTDDLRALGL